MENNYGEDYDAHYAEKLTKIAAKELYKKGRNVTEEDIVKIFNSIKISKIIR